MAKQRRALKPHSAEEQKHYEREARLQWGPASVNESIGRWNSYSQAQQAAIIADGNRIYSELAVAMEAGAEPGDGKLASLLDQWRSHLSHFYEPGIDYLRGLGQLYNSHPDFIANFQNIHRDLPAFLERVIEAYVDDLETLELERMLAEDEELARRRGNLSL